MKSKQTKSALLSSVVALVLCFAMLLGSTFAWFTDTASTSVNKIQAGTLKVDIVDAAGDSLQGKTLNFKKAAGHEDEEILWEPGCTYELEEFYIKNNGNLALEYQVVITGLDGDAKLNEAIEWDVTYAPATTALSGSVKVLLPGEKSGEIVVKGHMKETAGNEYQGLSIQGVAVTVYATQTPYEYDSYGNQYDANATVETPWDGVTTTAPTQDESGVYHITNAAEFVYAMEHSVPVMIGYENNEYNVGAFVLDSNINLGGATVTGFACDGKAYFRGSFDGQGYTISNFVIDNSESTEEQFTGLFGYLYGATVENLNVSGTTVIGQKQVGILAGCVSDHSTVTNCKVYNSTVIATKKVGTIAGYTLNSVVTDCYAENCEVYYSEKEGAEVIGFENSGCTVSDNTYSNVTVANKTFNTVSTAAELADALKNGGSYILTNDIDLGNVAWENITVSNALVLDGAGHTIKNLKVRNYNSEGSNGVQYGFGFIARANADVTISNLTFDGADVGPTEEQIAAEKGNIGGVVMGYSFGKTVLNNVTVKNSKVSGYGKLGALIGSVQNGTATLTGCTSTDNTIVGGTNLAGLIGNVVGKDNATVTNCTVENISFVKVRANETLYTLTSDVTVNYGDNQSFTLESGAQFNQNGNGYWYSYSALYYNSITGAYGTATIDGTAYNFCEEYAVNK